MIFAILHFLGGYCQIALSGPHQERFLNICVSKQICIWKLIRKDSHYIFYISRAGWKELDEIVAKTGCTYQCLSKKGLPFIFHRYKKRKIFILSLLISLGLFYVLSLFLWQIQVKGCYSHSEEEITDYLKDNGIKGGIKLSSISCHKLEEQIRKDYKDISWVSCDLKGTLLTVTIKETLDNEAIAEDKEAVPCNLIASKDGTIDSIIVRSGSAKVKKGDTVKAGDVLISGIVELFDDSGQLTETTNVMAEGDIYAITKQAYYDTFELLYYKKEYTGNTMTSLKLLIGKHLFSLPERENHFQNYDEKTKQIILHIGPQLYLPCSIFVTTKLECKIVEQKYSKKEALQEAKSRLALFEKEQEEKGLEILKNNVKITCDENQCTAGGTLMIRERFGKIQEIGSSTDEIQK